MHAMTKRLPRHNLIFPCSLIQGLTALAALPAASVPMVRPDPVSLACALVGCGLLLAPSGAPLRVLGVLACLPLVCAPLQRPGPGQLWLTALDVGQGMAVVVETPQRVLVYDLTVFVVVSSDKEPAFRELIEKRRETVRDRFTCLVRAADTNRTWAPRPINP